MLAGMVVMAATPTTSQVPKSLTKVAMGVMVGTPTNSRLPLTPMVEMAVVMVAAFMRARLLMKRLILAMEVMEGIPMSRLTPLMSLMVVMAIENLSGKGEWAKLLCDFLRVFWM